MVDFLRCLPAPERKLQVVDSAVASFRLPSKETTVAVGTRPPYGKRQGWVPRSLADFGDGGAFPEIPVAQYPLDMGRSEVVQKVVPLQVDANGRIAFDAVIKQGAAKEKLQVWTRPEDSREKWSKPTELERPTLELDALNTQRTQKALEVTLNGKIQAGLPKHQEKKESEFVRYTPNPNAPGYTPNCKERVIRITEKQKDPLEPPKFKHKKVPRGPPSPPPPVHHSPARKLTAKDQKDWKIPPCVSNWKNVKGYTIPLDKRLASDGRNLQDVTVNDKFAALSEDLYLAERKAREEIKIRNDMIRQKKVRDEETREQQLRELALQARQQRAELSSRAAGDDESVREAEERRQRMEVLNERKREIERDQRLELAGKKQKRGRDEDRDISERVALGQVAQPTSHEAMYDSRLFNQSAGLDSGYHGGSDEKCAVFDKPLFADRSQAGIYRFDRERLEQSESRMGHLGTKAFSGAHGETTREGRRNAPVEFDREEESGRRERRDDRRGDRSDRDRGRDRGRDSDDDRDEFGFGGLLAEAKKIR